MKKAMVMVLGAVALAGAAQADTVTWKNSNAYEWTDSAWDTGSCPGPNDTAWIAEADIFKSRFLDGKMQGVGLKKDEEIDQLVFADLYGMKVQGQAKMTFNAIRCLDMSPTAEDAAQVATNQVSAYLGLFLKGETSEFFVGTNHVLNLNSTVTKTQADTMVTKTGAGTLLYTGNGFEVDDVRIQEGEFIHTTAAYPSIKAVKSLTVGGGTGPALLEFGPTTHGTKFPNTCEVNVLSGGTIKIDAAGSLYHEYFKIDHGTIIAPDYVFINSNVATTERGSEYVFKGGTLVGNIQWAWGSKFTLEASDQPSVIQGKLNELAGELIDVPDGSAAVDFVLDGILAGGNRQYGKTGAGTMLFIDRDPSDLYGIGRDFVVNAGTFILQSETEIGLGTNNVAVAAGATFGGVGHQVGGLDPANEIRGVRGHITLNGAAGNPATLSVGTVDYKTGAYVPGTFTVGSAEQENSVTFNNECVLKIGTTPTGVSKLVVNGTFTLSGNDTLDIVGPTNSYELEPGTYEIVKTSEAMNTTFKAIAYNSGALPKNLKVTSTDKLITLRVAPKGLAIVIR